MELKQYLLGDVFGLRSEVGGAAPLDGPADPFDESSHRLVASGLGVCIWWVGVVNRHRVEYTDGPVGLGLLVATVEIQSSTAEPRR